MKKNVVKRLIISAGAGARDADDQPGLFNKPMKEGEGQRISRGVYSATRYMVDEMVVIQARYKGAIFSQETTAYLLDLSDRTPLFYLVTPPVGYNATSLKANGVKVYFVNHKLLRGEEKRM